MSDNSTSRRLRSLDTLRGFDMLFIMGGALFFIKLAEWFPTPFLQMLAEQNMHVGWNGLSAHDCIFPLFLFIAGISFPFSLSRQRAVGRTEGQIHRKVISRGLILLFLGFLYNGLLQFNIAEMRWMSVLGRIGLAWMFSALIFLHTRNTARVVWIAVLLVGYYLAMRYVPVDRPADATWMTPQWTLEARVDQLLLPGVLISGKGTFDPEGILSTIPAIATAMMGMLTGVYVRRGGALADGNRKTLVMLAVAAGLAVAGLIWNEFFPINKKLWSSSFVCVLGAISLFLFAVFYYIVDVRGWKGWTTFFVVIGMNSITIYLLQKFVSMWNTTNAIFGGVIGLFPEAAHGTVESAAYIATCWLLLYFLYKKKIFLKV